MKYLSLVVVLVLILLSLLVGSVVLVFDCFHSLFFTFFLRGLFQYGDLHFGHVVGSCVVRGIHLWLHRLHVSVGSSIGVVILHYLWL